MYAFKKEDILFNKLRPYLAKVYVADQEGECVGELLVLRPETFMASKFLFYRLLSKDFIEVVNSSTYGTKMPRASWESFIRNLVISYPCKEKQVSISTFLDHKTQQIDDLIVKKIRLIQLLKEERTALINHAITKGLDPTAPMKDSGIEWLGEIPMHWDIVRLKFLAKTIQTGNTPPSEKMEYYENPDLDWFTPSDFGDNLFLKDSNRKINSKAIIDGVAKIFNPHSVLIIGIGATLGKVGIIEMPASSNQQINSIEFNDLMNPIFGAYFLKTFESAVKNMSNAATLAILNQTNTKNIVLTCPPKEEQDTIVKFMVEIYSHVEFTTTRIEKEIELISEYKTSLINEVVTGKIEISDAI
jgi:type I restriction enzyme S subunit